MPEAGHNRPPHIVEFPDELFEFLKRNCEVNTRLNMQFLQEIHDGKPGTECLSDKTIQEIVDITEKFRAVAKLLESA